MNKPDWFNIDDYDYLNSIGVRGWASLLWNREVFDKSVINNKTINREAVFFELIKEYHEGLKKDPEYLDKKRSPFLTPGYPVSPLTSIEDCEFFLSEKQSKLLAIDIDCPDGILIDEFKKWLELVRKETPIPVKKRSIKKPEKLIIDKTHYQSWINYKIIPLWDLITWGIIKGNEFTNAELSYALYPEPGDNDEDRVRNGKGKLEDALSYVDALRSQASSIL